MPTWTRALPWLLVLMVGGCTENAAPAPGDFTVRGSVRRTVAPDTALGGDGRGTLHLILSTRCANNQGEAGQTVAAGRVDNADLSAPDSAVAFELRGIAPGTYQLSGFLDDVTTGGGDALPTRGDLVAFGSIAPRCVEVTVDGSDVDGVALELNYVMPFDL